MQDIQLPPDYYLSNFEFVAHWVEQRYESVVSATTNDFLQRYYQLDKPSRCLLLRMALRKGIFFRLNKLNYSEIRDINNASQQLCEAGLVSENPELDLTQLALLLTKNELCQLPVAQQLQLSSSQPKQQILDALDQFANQPTPWLHWTNNQFGSLLKLEIQSALDELILLFFGNPYQNLSEFVLQDLGLTRFEQYNISPQHLAISDSKDLLDYQHIIALREQLNDVVDAQGLTELTTQLPLKDLRSSMQRKQSRLINTLAYKLEQQGLFDEALRLYPVSDLPPARERCARVHERLGDYTAAWHLVDDMLANPVSEQEQLAAQRIAKRLAKHTGRHTQLTPRFVPHRSDLCLLIQRDLADAKVEELARRCYDRKATPCLHSENQLFNSVFGLWAWDALFADVSGAFSHPFQMAPSDLYHPDFYSKRQPIFDKLWKLSDSAFVTLIKQRFTQKNGISNRFVDWRYLTEDKLELALQCISADCFTRIFKRFLFDLKNNRNGLPDLIRLYPQQQSFELIEIKGPGDTLQDNQRRWLAYFQQHNIAATVVHVTYQEPSP